VSTDRAITTCRGIRCSGECSNATAQDRPVKDIDGLWPAIATLSDLRATSSHRGDQSVALTPTADTNRIGCHDPLSDVCALFLQVSDYIGQLCGILQAEDHVQLDRFDDLSSFCLVLILSQEASIPKFLKLP
jgi:hypothetical protein